MRNRELAVLLLLVLSACRQDMHDQPRHEPLEASDVFGDRRSARPKVEGTVARGQARLDSHLYTGREGGDFATSLPFPVDREVLERGRDRFDIYCSPCHGRLGNGNGMVVQRGFKRPPTYHQERLREMPIGYFYDVITNGFGTMYDYSARVSPRDRWAIAAYIRALQLSQHARLQDVPPAERAELEAVSR